MEILVAVISAIGGLFIFQYFNKARAQKGQAELETKVKDIVKKQDDITAGQKVKDAETKRKVDEITAEQDRKVTPEQLVDFFNSRKDE